MDFTFDKYRLLINCLKSSGYDILPVKDYLENRPESEFVILRHDVDRVPKKSLKIAELEAKEDVRSTYYVRYPHTFESEIIERISNLGHEIGYHYEVFSKADGDHRKALELFREELKKFREVVDVKTVCMHGSPLSKYDNKELWENLNYEEHGLLGEAYFSIDDFDIYYFTDTGRRWDEKYNLRDKHRYNKVEGIKSTKELTEILNGRNFKKLYITTHPAKWGGGSLECLYLWAKDFVFNMGKKVLQVRY